MKLVPDERNLRPAAVWVEKREGAAGTAQYHETHGPGGHNISSAGPQAQRNQREAASQRAAWRRHIGEPCMRAQWPRESEDEPFDWPPAVQGQSQAATAQEPGGAAGSGGAGIQDLQQPAAFAAHIAHASGPGQAAGPAAGPTAAPPQAPRAASGSWWNNCDWDKIWPGSK